MSDLNGLLFWYFNTLSDLQKSTLLISIQPLMLVVKMLREPFLDLTWTASTCENTGYLHTSAF
jgi:hypothetical protein